jgi:hypothetical protein
MAKKEDFTANSSVIVDGTHIDTFKKEIVSANILEVEVGTTGYMGGDTGHGGRTFFRIKDLASTDMRLAFRDNGKYYKSRYLNDLELIFGGDCELDTFCEALRIGYNVLSQHSTGTLIDDFMPSPLEQRQERFALYINELCEHYRKRGSLKGMSDIRNKHHITGLTQQQFFECDLHHASGYVSREFCDRVYAFILDTTKAIPAPKYDDVK